MPKRTEVRSLKGLTVTSTQLDALEALPLMSKLSHVLASLMDENGEISLKQDAQVFLAVLQSIESDELKKLSIDILRRTELNDGESRFEMFSEQQVNKAFQGHLDAFFPTLAFALEVTFGGFFGDGVSESDSESDSEHP